MRAIVTMILALLLIQLFSAGAVRKKKLRHSEENPAANRSDSTSEPDAGTKNFLSGISRGATILIEELTGIDLGRFVTGMKAILGESDEVILQKRWTSVDEQDLDKNGQLIQLLIPYIDNHIREQVQKNGDLLMEDNQKNFREQQIHQIQMLSELRNISFYCLIIMITICVCAIISVLLQMNRRLPSTPSS